MADKMARFGIRTLDRIYELAESEEGLWEESEMRRVSKLLFYFDEGGWKNAKRNTRVYESNLEEERGSFEVFDGEEALLKYKVNGALGGFKIPAGAYSPYRLITGTFRRLLDRYPNCLSIETNTPVIAISHNYLDNQEYPYQVTTPRGTIQAKNVIHCTKGHAGHLLPLLRGKIAPWRGTMSCQTSPPKFPKLRKQLTSTFSSSPTWNKEKNTVKLGWYYMAQDTSQNNIWVGGENKAISEIFTADDSSIGDFGKKTLAEVLPTLFTEEIVKENPELKGIWSGIMAYTADSLPFVGRLPAFATGRNGEGEWVGAGYNSYGMANGLGCGEAVAKMLVGEDVCAWLPEAYLCSEERLMGTDMTAEKVVGTFWE